jgi:multidrug efflux pump
VLLGDVATIVDGLENSKVAGWYQGRPAIIIEVQRQPGANVIETVKGIRSEMPKLARALPSGSTLLVIHDRTGTIKASIHDVQFSLVLAVALVVLVVLLFLRSLSATFIAAVTLPLSIVATFGVMWFAGFSLDNLSLMALTIGTGFVVDDAIVMIENIVRHVEEGDSPLEAALKGAREIGFTVISLTASLIAVFIPLLFMTGLVGRMFREFALTLTIAVVVSAVVSLTLTPMMCGRVMRSRRDKAARRPERLSRFADRVIDGSIEGYRRTLEWVIVRRKATLLVTGLTLAATVWLYIIVPKGFLPSQDTGFITAVTEAGPDASFEEVTRIESILATAISKDPDVENVVSIIGVSTTNPTPNAGRLQIVLKPRNERKFTADQIAERLKATVENIPGATVYFQPVQDVQIATRVSRAQYQYTLMSTDEKAVIEWSDKLLDKLRRSPLLKDTASETQEGGLRAYIKVDRALAGRLGISMQAINDTLNDAFGQRQISTIYAQANQYRVVLEALPEYQRDPASFAKLYVPSTSGAQVPLSSFATLERRTAPLRVSHQEQFPSATLSFNLGPGAALSDALNVIAEAEKEIGMPTSVVGTYAGDAAEFGRSLESQPWLILAAAITIYIVLGMLYESFLHPLTILSTLPSAGVGALLALMVTGLDLSVVALIGIILLMGIVKKNAIMMIDFALDAERKEGLSPRSAIMKACLLRFRPIMMTTLAALFGALPLALESGTGSELRNPLGVTIIGGLLLSQLLTLYTTPVIYLTLEDWKRRLAGRPSLAASDAAAPADPQQQAAE